jgi:hypothetical protein
MTYKIKGEAVIDSLGNIVYTENDIIANTSLTFKSGPPGPGGFVAGYTSGGFQPAAKVTIDKFPFATDSNATDVGDLSFSRFYPSSNSSETSGYSVGGLPLTTTIDKFPFAVDVSALVVGNLTVAKSRAAGQSDKINGYGYTSGGVNDPGPAVYNVVEKFPFAADGNSVQVGTLTQARFSSAGQNSLTFGYTSGGAIPTHQNTIDKFPFATDGAATDVGDLTTVRLNCAGQNSSTSGYTSGGSPNVNIIEKFSFAVDANATDVGDLTQGRYSPAGQSSQENGYTSGGYAAVNIIDKFPFAVDTNATDVGDLTIARGLTSGQQA